MSSTRPGLLVESSDFDNCMAWFALLSNNHFREKFKLRVTSADQWWQHFLTESQYVKELAQQIEQTRAAKVVLLNGSFRQGLYHDALSRSANMATLRESDSGSVFHFWEALAGRLKTVLTCPVEYDRITAVDVMSNDKPGATFLRAQTRTLGLGLQYPFESHVDVPWMLSAWVDSLRGESEKMSYRDVTKVTLLFMQMWHVSRTHPEHAITFRFRDDSAAIVLLIQTFFSRHPEWMPANVKLQTLIFTPLHERADKGYEKAALTALPSAQVDMDQIKLDCPPIQGTGSIRKDFNKLVAALHRVMVAKVVASPEEFKLDDLPLLAEKFRLAYDALPDVVDTAKADSTQRMMVALQVKPGAMGVTATVEEKPSISEPMTAVQAKAAPMIDDEKRAKSMSFH